MKEVIKVVNRELLILNKEARAIDIERRKLERTLHILKGEKPVSEKATRSKKIKRRPAGQLQSVITELLNEHGAMTTREMAGHLSDVPEFQGKKALASTLRSTCYRMVDKKELGRLDTESGVVFTTQGLTFSSKSGVKPGDKFLTQDVRQS